MPLPVIIGIAAGVIVIIVGIAVYFTRKKRPASGAAASAAKQSAEVQITGGSADPVQVPTEQTCTFTKATMETMCGINMTSGTNGKDTVVLSLNPAGAAASCGLAVGDTVLSINGMRVTSPDQAATLLKSVEGDVKICTARLVRQQSMVSDKI